MSRPSLIINQGQKGRFTCCEKGAEGACVEGSGKSALEAIGDWCVHSATVEVRCDPPALLKEWSVATPYIELEHDPAPRRD